MELQARVAKNLSDRELATFAQTSRASALMVDDHLCARGQILKSVWMQAHGETFPHRLVEGTLGAEFIRQPERHLAVCHSRGPAATLKRARGILDELAHAFPQGRDIFHLSLSTREARQAMSMTTLEETLPSLVRQGVAALTPCASFYLADGPFVESEATWRWADAHPAAASDLGLERPARAGIDGADESWSPAGRQRVPDWSYGPVCVGVDARGWALFLASLQYIPEAFENEPERERDEVTVTLLRAGSGVSSPWFIQFYAHSITTPDLYEDPSMSLFFAPDKFEPFRRLTTSNDQETAEIASLFQMLEEIGREGVGRQSFEVGVPHGQGGYMDVRWNTVRLRTNLG